MTATHFAPLGHFVTAAFLGKRAAGIEATARRWIDWAWNFAFQLLRLVPIVRIQRRNRRQQRLGIGMSGFGKQLACRRRLDDLPEVHNGDKIAGMRDYAQIMADKQEGDAALLLNRVQQVQYVGLDRYVERRNAFVGDDKLRIRYQRAGDRNTLALAAGERMRETP